MYQTYHKQMNLWIGPFEVGETCYIVVSNGTSHNQKNQSQPIISESCE